MFPIRNPIPNPRRWKDDFTPPGEVSTPSSQPKGFRQTLRRCVPRIHKPTAFRNLRSQDTRPKTSERLKRYDEPSVPNSTSPQTTNSTDLPATIPIEADHPSETLNGALAHYNQSSPIHIRPSQLSFLISFVIHTAFLLILAMSVFSGINGTKHHPILLNASVSEAGDLGQGELLTSLTIEPPAMSDQSQSDDNASSIAQTLENTSRNSAAQALTEIAELTRLNPGDLLSSANTSALPNELATLSELANHQTDEGASGTSQVPGQATFFGSKAYGTKFVYIIDASTSMEGYRWNRAIGELLKSIGQLSDGTEYFVIAFHVEAVPIDLSRAATKTFLVKNKSSVVMSRRWLRQLQLAPQTMPATSLRLALDFNPDAVFMLSDGELRDNSLAMLRSLNQSDSGKTLTPIHSIHLFSNDGRETLKALAEENGGTFTAVRGGE